MTAANTAARNWAIWRALRTGQRTTAELAAIHGVTPSRIHSIAKSRDRTARLALTRNDPSRLSQDTIDGMKGVEFVYDAGETSPRIVQQPRIVPEDGGGDLKTAALKEALRRERAALRRMRERREVEHTLIRELRAALLQCANVMVSHQLHTRGLHHAMRKHITDVDEMAKLGKWLQNWADNPRLKRFR